MMWKPDFPILVPFVKSTEKYDCSSAKNVDPKKCKLEQLATVSNKQGRDIRKFYEDLVNSDEILSPWSDTIQNKDTEITLESLSHRTNNGKSKESSKRKLIDYTDSSKTKTIISSTLDTTTNCSVFKPGDYESKAETSESLPCRTNHGKNSTYLKRKIDDSDTSKTKTCVVSSSNPDDTMGKTTNCSIFKHDDHYKSKLNTTITSESLNYSSNSGKTSPYLKGKNLDYSTSSKTRVTSTYKNHSEPERGDDYKTELNTSRTPEPLIYSSNNSKTDPYSKRKNLDYPASLKTPITLTSRSSPERRNIYKTKLKNTTKKLEPLPYSSNNSKISSYFEYSAPSKIPKTNVGTVEIPSNSIPSFCRNNDDIIKKFSQEHIQNSVLRCAQEGDLLGLKRHLESGSVDVNCTDSFGWTPLMCASFSGHIDVVKFLLSVDDVDDSYRNCKHQSALGLSSKGGHSRIRKLLENHRRKSIVSASSHKNEAARYNSQDPEDKSPSSEYFCDVCKIQVKNTTKSAHEASTLHLLNLHPKPLPQSYFLSEQNRGFQIMVKTGWDESKGLGPTGEGRRIPIKTILKQDRKGLGVKSSNTAKVSHFDARDTNAVKHKQSIVIKALNKKKLASIHKREKRKERYLRRCLDLD